MILDDYMRPAVREGDVHGKLLGYDRLEFASLLLEIQTSHRKVARICQLFITDLYAYLKAKM